MINLQYTLVGHGPIYSPPPPPWTDKLSTYLGKTHSHPVNLVIIKLMY